jgi:hypothetical protein
MGRKSDRVRCNDYGNVIKLMINLYDREELGFDSEGGNILGDCDLPADLVSQIPEASGHSDEQAETSYDAPPNASDTMSSLGIEKSTKLFAHDDSDKFFPSMAMDTAVEACAQEESTPILPADHLDNTDLQAEELDDAYGGVSISSINAEGGDAPAVHGPAITPPKPRVVPTVQLDRPLQQNASPDDLPTPPAAEVFAFLTQRRRSKTVASSTAPPPESRTTPDIPSIHAPLVAVTTGGSSTSTTSDTYRPSNRTSLDGTRPVVHHLRPSLVGALPPPPSYPEPRMKRKRSQSASAVDEERANTKKVTVARASKMTMSPAQMQYVEVPAGIRTDPVLLNTCIVGPSSGRALRSASPSPARTSRIPRKSPADSPPVPPLPAEITLIHPTPETSAQIEKPDTSLWQRNALGSKNCSNVPLSDDLFMRKSVPLPEDPFTHKPVRQSHKRAAPSTTGQTPSAKRRDGRTKEKRSGGRGSQPPESKTSKMARKASSDKENNGTPSFVVSPLPPMTPVRQRMKVIVQGSEPPSPASSSELSPVAKNMMANVREQRMQMRARDHEREKARGRRFASRTASRG